MTSSEAKFHASLHFIYNNKRKYSLNIKKKCYAWITLQMNSNEKKKKIFIQSYDRETQTSARIE